MEVVPQPSKKQRTNKAGKSAKSTPTKTTKSKYSSKDLWTTVGFIWPAHERPPGLLQDRDWVNAQSYESISLMKKAGIFVIYILLVLLYIKLILNF